MERGLLVSWSLFTQCLVDFKSANDLTSQPTNYDIIFAMFKLIILIEPGIDEAGFFDGWPQFLAHAENLPELVKVVSAPVHNRLTGQFNPLMVHELYFPTQQALQRAMTSEEGVAAGETLQRITGGAVTLLVAGHMEDSGENLRAYHPKRTIDTQGGNDE